MHVARGSMDIMDPAMIEDKLTWQLAIHTGSHSNEKEFMEEVITANEFAEAVYVVR